MERWTTNSTTTRPASSRTWSGRTCRPTPTGRWRTREDVDAQRANAWRVVGVYVAGTGEQVGFARAASDGVGFAYLADVFVLPDHRGHELGKRLVRRMIDEGPGRDFRWTLFTADAHGLYEQFGFAAPDATALVRPSRLG